MRASDSTDQTIEAEKQRSPHPHPHPLPLAAGEGADDGGTLAAPALPSPMTSRYPDWLHTVPRDHLAYVVRLPDHEVIPYLRRVAAMYSIPWTAPDTG